MKMFNIVQQNLPSILQKPVKQFIEAEEYVKFKIDYDSASNNNNLFGSLHTIDVKGKTKDGDKELNLFIKSIRNDEKFCAVVSITNIYKTELLFYEDVIKVFQEMEEEANVPVEARFKTVKYYEQSTPEVIIMENVARKGFKVYNNKDVVSLQFAEVSIKELAKFHALSFTLKVKRPEYFENKIKVLKNHVIKDDNYKAFLANAKNITIPFVDEKYKKKVEKIYDELYDKYATYFNNETVTACLCHGDFKPNNIMVKFQDDKIAEVIFLDYQLMQYACPVYDFLYFIYLSTDREFRKAHLEYLKSLYYESLGVFMKNFDVDLETVYPKKKFEKEYQERLVFGLEMSLCCLLILFMPENGEIDMRQFNFKLDSGAKDRIQGVVDEFAEMGYL